MFKSAIPGGKKELEGGWSNPSPLYKMVTLGYAEKRQPQPGLAV